MFEDFYLDIELLDKNAKMPTRAYPSDAGCDVYAPEKVTIFPGRDALIPLGWRCKFPEGYALVFFDKSGVSTKKKLKIGACVDPNTLIETNKGFFPAIELTKEFIQKNDIRVLSYNIERKEKEYKEFDGFRQSNYTDCYQIEFDDGTILECSSDHKVLTSKGWVEAKDLNENHDILT